MAAGAAVHPSPPALARRTVASLACTHLAWAAFDAVNCLFLASMWLLYWGQATKAIGWLACGEGCAVVTAADKVVSVAMVILALVYPFTVLMLVLITARTKAAAAAAATGIEEPAAAETLYAAVQDMPCGSLALGLLASMAFILLMPIGVLVKGDSPLMGSRRERMGSVMYDMGTVGTAMVNCFVSGPIITVWIWKTWRKTQHARYVETKP